MSKKVKFSPRNAEYIPFPNESLWADDYAEARVSNWQSIALDRMRFQRRIAITSELLRDIHNAQILSFNISKIKSIKATRDAKTAIISK